MKVVNYTVRELRALPILERLLILEGKRRNGTYVETPEAHKPGYRSPECVEMDRTRVARRRSQVTSFLSNRGKPTSLPDIAAAMCVSPSTAKVYCADLLKEGVIGREKDPRHGKFMWHYIGDGT